MCFERIFLLTLQLSSRSLRLAMLRIRLTRTGKNTQPSYRIVVAEHSSPAKAKFVEILGHYNISRTPRILEVNQDRVKYWISVGAKPSDTMAVLLKSLGMANMEQYIAPRTLKRKKKKGGAEEAAAPKVKVTESVEAAPVEKPAEVVAEAPAEAAPVEEKPAEAVVEAPAPEAPVETPSEPAAPSA